MTRMSKPIVVLFGCSFGMLGLCVVLPLVILFSSCSFNKYVLAAGLPTPDAGFQTGNVAGYNVYIWECYHGKRIVLYNTSSELLSMAFQRQEAPCGGTTEIEKTLAKETKRNLNPSTFW
jgi:hypothetical protein